MEIGWAVLSRFSVGGKGDDRLDGYSTGGTEYDTLVGGNGFDTFVLGDSSGAYYQGESYATIQDWEFPPISLKSVEIPNNTPLVLII